MTEVSKKRADVELDPSLLAKLLRYDCETGALFWRERGEELFTDGVRWTAAQQAKRWNTQFAGKEAFTASMPGGYGIGAIFSKAYRKHRVCWAIYHRAWPENQIDHINGDRSDNRIQNLRDVSNRENSINSGIKKNNTTGFAGVSLDRGKYRAQIKVFGRQIFLGYFDSAVEAHEAYCKAKIEHGFSERHGT